MQRFIEANASPKDPATPKADTRSQLLAATESHRVAAPEMGNTTLHGLLIQKFERDEVRRRAALQFGERPGEPT